MPISGFNSAPLSLLQNMPTERFSCSCHGASAHMKMFQQTLQRIKVLCSPKEKHRSPLRERHGAHFFSRTFRGGPLAYIKRPEPDDEANKKIIVIGRVQGRGRRKKETNREAKDDAIE